MMIHGGTKYLGTIKMIRTTKFFAVLFLLFGTSAFSFCGFFVAKADTKLFNQASKVILARDGDRTVLTMANDFQAEVAAFAIVVPVPVSISSNWRIVS